MSDRCHGNHRHIDTLSVCISGEYNLMITPLELEDDGVYECQIGATATTAGMRSTPAYVTVKCEYLVLLYHTITSRHRNP